MTLQQTADVATQYASAQGGVNTHKAWTESLKGLGRQASEELRLWPSMPQEDKAMFETIARSVARDYDEWTGAPLKAAGRLLLDSAEAHDDNRMLVSREALQQLATALERPLDLGKARVNVQTIDGGRFLAEFNTSLESAVTQLEAGRSKGEIKVKALVKLKREGFIYSLSPDVEILGGKQEKTEFFIKAKLDGGELRPYDPKAEALAVKDEVQKKTKAASKKAKPSAPPPAPAAYAKGDKVNVTLSAEGNTTTTVSGTVTAPHESGGYFVDYGDGEMLIPPDRLSAIPPYQGAA